MTDAQRALTVLLDHARKLRRRELRAEIAECNARIRELQAKCRELSEELARVRNQNREDGERK